MILKLKNIAKDRLFFQLYLVNHAILYILYHEKFYRLYNLKIIEDDKKILNQENAILVIF